MNFPPQFLDEIRQRVPVSEVVGRKVPLKRAGREMVGLSPFKQEKTPSFTVNDDKGFYHCFASGEHGDIFAFLMKTEGLSFPEAVERLASQAGLPMPVQSPQEAERYKKQSTLMDCTAAAAEWYAAQLSAGVGAGARDYVRKRGLKAETVTAFSIGYAPASRTALKEALIARKFTEAQLVESGMLIKPEDGGETYDRFRNRLMFPIRDRQGRVVAFGGRALDADARAKYLNSPETPLFHKGHLLYNMDKARRAAQQTGRVIVVEGYMDVIGLAQGGFADAVAPLGTALTTEQIVELWRLADEPVLCFDGDSAGRKAAYRAVERVLPILAPGKSLMFAYLPEGEDPDSLVKSQGKAAMQAVLDQARPLSDVVWDMLLETHRTDTPERRSGFEKALFDTVNMIKDETVRSGYRSAMRERLRRQFAPAQAERGRYAGRRPVPPMMTIQLKNNRLAASDEEGILRKESQILLGAIFCPLILEFHEEEVALMELHSSELDELRAALINIAANETKIDQEKVIYLLEQQGCRGLLEKATSHVAGDANVSLFSRNDVPFHTIEAYWLDLLESYKRFLEKRELDQLATAVTDSSDDPTSAYLQALTNRASGHLKHVSKSDEESAHRSPRESEDDSFLKGFYKRYLDGSEN